MSFSQRDLYKGIIARLKAYSDLTDIVGQRIYTNVPNNPTFPYLTVTINSSDDSLKDRARQEHTLAIQSYSRDSAVGELVLIHEEIFNALSRKESSVTLDNGLILNLLLETVAGPVKDPDGKTWLQVSLYTVSMA